MRTGEWILKDRCSSDQHLSLRTLNPVCCGLSSQIFQGAVPEGLGELAGPGRVGDARHGGFLVRFGRGGF